MKNRKQIQFTKTEWIHNNIMLRIRSQGQMSKQTDVVRRDLTRYYYLMLFTASEIELNVEEFQLIRDALKKYISTSDELLPVRMLPVLVEEYLAYNIVKTSGDSCDTLLNKVKSMTAAQKQCIVDVLERYFNSENKNIEYTSFLELFKQFSFFEKSKN